MLGKDSVTSTTTSESPSESLSVSPRESAHAKSGSLLATGSEAVHAASVHAAESASLNSAPPDTRERWAYQWVDSRLKALSIFLPVAFIVILELIRSRIGGTDDYRDRLIFVLVSVVAILAFGLVMFRFIDRAQRQVVRQNRELAATNSVSSAVQGEVSVDQIIDVVLESVLSTSGAEEASVTVFDTEDRSPDGAGVTRRRVMGPGPAAAASRGPCGSAPVIDFPLSTGTLTVGRMRLRLPVGAGVDDCLASGTLQNIGHQLASAIQRAQLVADLQRRKHEGHAFYDVLLQISNQNAPPDILTAVVQHARDMMGSDEAVISLDEDASRSVQFALTLEGAVVAEGTSCITSEIGLRHSAHGHETACPVRSSPEWRASMKVPIRGPIGTLGELWIGRRSNTLFTERDRAFLVTLSGLAAIAITSAQMRENGRQRAVLAERGRIAREMHDSLAQVLGVTHLRLRALDAREDVRDNPEVAVELAELADITQEAYRDVRESILGLRGSNRTERGLLDNLRAYLVKYSQQCQIATSLDGDLDEVCLSPRCEVQVIRVIQEALTNVRKHSGARSAIVHVTESETGTTFVVEDDGQGFDAVSQFDRDGFGLYTMRERMALLNGSLTVESQPGRGTRVIAEVPERSRPRSVHNEVKHAAARTDPHPAG